MAPLAASAEIFPSFNTILVRYACRVVVVVAFADTVVDAIVVAIVVAIAVAIAVVIAVAGAVAVACA